MSIFYQMCRETAFTISVFKVTQLFLTADFERSPCLSCILHITSRECYLVNSSVLFFALMTGVFFLKQFPYGIITEVGDFDLTLLNTSVMALVSLPIYVNFFRCVFFTLFLSFLFANYRFLD